MDVIVHVEMLVLWWNSILFHVLRRSNTTRSLILSCSVVTTVLSRPQIIRRLACAALSIASACTRPYQLFRISSKLISQTSVRFISGTPWNAAYGIPFPIVGFF